MQSLWRRLSIIYAYELFRTEGARVDIDNDQHLQPSPTAYLLALVSHYCKVLYIAYLHFNVKHLP